MDTLQASTSPETWLRGYYIATYAIAAVAIVSLYFSLRSSQKVSAALTTIQKGLVSLTDPLIQIVDYTWISDTPELSCSHPPTGVMLTYRNLSNVPVIIRHSDFRVFYGEKEFNDIVMSTDTAEDGTQLLAPGVALQSGTVQKELFHKYLSNPKDMMAPPHLAVTFELTFESLGSRTTYIYKTKQQLLFNCATPGTKGRKVIYETLERIKPPELPARPS